MLDKRLDITRLLLFNQIFLKDKILPYNETDAASKNLSVCKVRTQDPENFEEEVKSLLTAWRKRWILCGS